MQKDKEVLSSILYIEDDSLNREIVVMFLKDCFMVDTAADSTEALEKISKNNYAVILLDISLCKGLNGIELAGEIKKIKNYKDVPIIAVTAYALREDENRILNSGFTHYISKPFTKTVLLENISNALTK
jgi:two-component system, sensor histidine kinase